MEHVLGILIAPVIIFCIFVAPLWIIFHYVFNRNRSGREDGAQTESDRKKIEELLRIAERMENRIQTLESILDKQDTQWRSEI